MALLWILETTYKWCILWCSFSVTVNNTIVYMWYAVEPDSGAVQGRGGYDSFLTNLWLTDVLGLSAHFEMDSKLKLMDPRIR